MIKFFELSIKTESLFSDSRGYPIGRKAWLPEEKFSDSDEGIGLHQTKENLSQGQV